MDKTVTMLVEPQAAPVLYERPDRACLAIGAKCRQADACREDLLFGVAHHHFWLAFRELRTLCLPQRTALSCEASASSAPSKILIVAGYPGHHRAASNIESFPSPAAAERICPAHGQARPPSGASTCIQMLTDIFAPSSASRDWFTTANMINVGSRRKDNGGGDVRSRPSRQSQN
jgi:hypothetical protein